MFGMSGCSGSQHGQNKGTNVAATDKSDSTGKQISLDSNLGQKVDIGV